MWADGIKSVRFVPSLPNGSPACVHRATGIILVDQGIWDRLKRDYPDYYKDMRYFILLHEYMHVALKSRNEKEVDAMARKVYLSENRSHKALIFVLTELLTVSKRGHKDRILLQFIDTWNHDYQVNRNPKMNFSL